MGEKYTQKDYFLYLIYRNKVLEILKKELEKIEERGKKTLWFYSAQETLKHLVEDEKGRNLTPHDVDNIVYALLNRIEEKRKEKLM